MGELTSKRWQQVLRELVMLVKESTVEMIVWEDKEAYIMSIAATFGTKSGYRYGADWESFRELCVPDNHDKILETLWEDVREVLAGEICYNGPITQVPQHFIDDAKIMAGHLDIDIDALFQKQVEAIPVPKSWPVLAEEKSLKKTKKVIED
jgi:hypothetical protein